MAEVLEGKAARPGRCANHPAVAQVGSCESCGRSLCIACAIPVRGQLIGPECLAKMVRDVPVPAPVPEPVYPRGDRVALLGFGLVVATTLLPWSRFGASPRFLGAWNLHWPLLAAVAGVLGVLVALMGRYRGLDARVEIGAYALLAVLVVIAALMHRRHPPLLSEITLAPVGAVIGAAIAMLGAVAKLVDFVKARRPAA